MKILLLAPAFFPAIGGAEAYAKSLATGLANRGHRVKVLTAPHKGAPERETMPSGYQIVRSSRFLAALENPGKLLWEQMAFAVLDNIAASVIDEKPDVIFANSMDMAIAGCIAGLDMGRPVVANYHEIQAEFDPMGNGRLRFAYATLPLAALIAGSNFYTQRATRFGAEKRKVHHIPLGADGSIFRPIATAAASANNEFRVILSGRFTARKQQVFAVRVAEKLRRSGIPISLTLAGGVHSSDDSYVQKIQATIEDLGAASYVQLRNASHDGMADLYRECDVAIQPSTSEGLGLALIEAMLCGITVVGSDTAGISEVIESDHLGVLLPPGDLEAWVDALSALWRDPDTRHRIAAAGHSHVRQHMSSR